jgi:large subunit ribosomal protein L18e
MTASNPILRGAAVLLERAAKKQNAPIWNEASKLLSADSRNRVEVNLGRISRVAQEGRALFVPGKVLGTGVVDKKLVIGAFSFSESARSKLESAGGSALTINQFLKKYPKGSGVQLVR